MTRPSSGVLVVASFALRSPCLALGGVIGSALLALPLALFLYCTLGFRHIGALHAISLFIAAAIGADDVCVVAGHLAHSSHGTRRERMRNALGGSFRLVGATSLTTGIAFASNLFSNLPLVRQFGAFVALLVLSLLLLVHTWLPPLLLLSERRTRACAHAPSDAPRGSPAIDSPSSDVGSCTLNKQDTETTAVKGENDIHAPAVDGSISEGRFVVTPAMQKDGNSQAIAQPAHKQAGGAVASREPRGREVLWLHSSRFFASSYASWIGAHHKALAAAGVGLLLLFISLAFQIEPPRGPLSPFPPWHNQYRYLRTELTMAGSVARIDVRLFWGIHTISDELLGERASFTRVEGFDACTPEAQLFFVRACERLQHAPSRRADGSRVGCPFDRSAFVERAMSSLAHSNSSRRSDGLVANLAQQLPLPRSDCLRVLRELWQSDHGLRVYYDPAQSSEAPVALSAWVPTSISAADPFPAVREEWGEWEAWLANLSASAPNAALGEVFHTGGGGWELMETAETLSHSARYGLVISMVLALLFALLFTQSIRIAMMAGFCICASSCGFIGLQGAMGWPFGVIESICATVVVGLACDYTMHVAVSTVHLRGDLRATLALIGPPMCAAAATTFVAGVALLPCTIVLFSRFGAFVVATVACSLTFALVVLPSLLVCSGAAFISHTPESEFLSRSLRSSTTAACGRTLCETSISVQQSVGTQACSSVDPGCSLLPHSCERSSVSFELTQSQPHIQSGSDA